jgi:hypothetical protein
LLKLYMSRDVKFLEDTIFFYRKSRGDLVWFFPLAWYWEYLLTSVYYSQFWFCSSQSGPTGSASSYICFQQRCSMTESTPD